MNHFVFSNLTTFELSPSIVGEDSGGLCLLNFLKASPLLQTVEISPSAKIELSSIPQEIVVVLPNVKTFSLHVPNVTTPQVYGFASHVSCPCAKYTSLTHDACDDEVDANLEVFPTPAVWNTIIHQYMASPIEEVTLDMKRLEDEQTSCFLTFQSSDATVVKLGFTVHETGAGEVDLSTSIADMSWQMFSQALMSTRNHPLLSHVKRLHIKQRTFIPTAYQMPWVASKFHQLICSLGPLDELTIRGCDLNTFLANFIDSPELNRWRKPAAFPQTKELKIQDPSVGGNEVRCMETVVELAKSQHALGIPFECMMVCMLRLHPEVAEELGRWAAAVDCGVWREEREDL